MDLHALYLRRRFWLADLLHGSPIGKPHREIRWLDTHSEAEGRQLRQHKLQTMLKWAATHCPYYKAILPPQISR